jgi:hypothetical protein
MSSDLPLIGAGVVTLLAWLGAGCAYSAAGSIMFGGSDRDVRKWLAVSFAFCLAAGGVAFVMAVTR